MKYFKQVDNLLSVDLKTQMLSMINDGIIDFNTRNEVCLNSTVDRIDDFRFGTGSLIDDWDRAYEIVHPDGVVELKVPRREKRLEESDFSVLCSQFKNTLFEAVYTALNDRFVLGRVRLMRIQQHVCMGWHTDTTDRLHYPIITNPHCRMLIENELMHIPQNEWWIAFTKHNYHTAFNASQIDRIHLVASIYGEK